MKFEHMDDHSHTMASKNMQSWRVKNRVGSPNVVYVANKETFDENEAALAPQMAPVSVPPPGRVDGFSPFGRGHSPGIGHSIQN